MKNSQKNRSRLSPMETLIPEGRRLHDQAVGAALAAWAGQIRRLTAQKIRPAAVIPIENHPIN